MVGLRADQNRRGPVIAELPPVAGRPRYTVFHGATEVRTYYEDQLVEVEQPPSLDSFAESLIGGLRLDGRTFRARLAAARLSHPLTDTLYALQAARILSIPFQFKPLLRFLRADRPRILISDDVGVGKTIEAGLILKELETRQQLDSVLVVCPKALTAKWRMEMRRFDEDFRELSPELLRYCLRETAYDGAWPAQYGRAIVSLELLRVERYLQGEDTGRRRIDGLLTLDPPPRFGLLIVDEAHHLRNAGTKSHEVAEFLCDVSEAVVFLTATPVHLGAGDLYSLLNLLRPDLFRDEAVFDVMVEPNRHLAQAMRLLRAGGDNSDWQAAAADELRLAAGTQWGRRSLVADPRFRAWLARLDQPLPLEVVERVRGLRDLEEVHSLALVVNRTRRRDIGDFKNAGRAWVREPTVVNVHDFPSDADGRAVPYGVYDITTHRGLIYLGRSGDTAAFAADAIAAWWQTEGRATWSNRDHLLLLADAGGSNSCRTRAWKERVQVQVCDRFGLTVTVCHYPTGCSKWNPTSCPGGGQLHQ
jgi:ATP-dependent helicase HepA